MNSFKQKLIGLRDMGASKVAGAMDRSNQMNEAKIQNIVDQNYGGNREAFNQHMDSIPEADKTDILTRMARGVGKGVMSFADKLAQLRTKSSGPK